MTVVAVGASARRGSGVQRPRDLRALRRSPPATYGRSEPGPINAVLVTGTGLVSVASIYQMDYGCSRPILSSNLCGAWWDPAAVRPQSGQSV